MNERDINEQIDEIYKVIEELIELNNTSPVIVEGEKDIEALHSLGLTGVIFKVNTGTSLLNKCEKIACTNNEVIILTDWDRKGGIIARRLSDVFKSLSVKTNLNIRAKFAILCKKDIKDVESIAKFLMTLKNKSLIKKQYE